MEQPNLSQKSLLQQPKINKFRILQQTILRHFICKPYLITLNKGRDNSGYLSK